MISALFSVLVASAGSAVSPAVAPRSALSDDPPIRISLSSDGYYYQGDRAKVRVRVAEDGYLLVLRADADGHVRVLFPLDPGDDDFVRGGHEFELRGRGDRETFFVDEVRGTGTILAARSATPFRYDRFVRGDHWDYRVLGNDRIGDDAEAGLLDLVDEMADSAHYDYDVTTYSVGGGSYRPYYSRSYGGYYGPGYRPGLSIGFYFGSPYYRRYCDPFLYDPFFCDSSFYDPFFYDPFYYSYYQPFGYGCFGNPFCGYRRGYGYYTPGGGRPFTGFTFKRPIPQPPLVLPRQRFPSAGTRVRWSDPPPVSRFGGRDQPEVDPRRRAAPPPSTAGDSRRDPPPPSNARPRSNGGSASSGGDNGGGRGGRSGGGWSSGGGGGGRSSGGWSSGGGGGRSTPSASSGGSRPSNGGGGRRRP